MLPNGLLLKEGHTDTHNKERSGRLSVISEKLMQQVEEKVCNNCRVTFDITRKFPTHFTKFSV